MFIQRPDCSRCFIFEVYCDEEFFLESTRLYDTLFRTYLFDVLADLFSSSRFATRILKSPRVSIHYWSHWALFISRNQPVYIWYVQRPNISRGPLLIISNKLQIIDLRIQQNTCSFNIIPAYYVARYSINPVNILRNCNYHNMKLN